MEINFEKIFKPVLIPSVIILALAMLTCPFLSKINLDAGYYVGAISGMHQGMLPYADIHFGHTPLYMLFLYPLRCWISDTYWLCVASAWVSALLLILSTALIAHITHEVTNNKTLAWGSLLCLPTMYVMGPGNIQLEPYFVFFGVAAIALIIHEQKNWWYVAGAGLCLGLSFLSKQYGLLFSAAVGMYLLFSSNSIGQKIGKVAVLVCSFLLPIIATLYILWGMGITPELLFEKLFLNGYGSVWKHAYILGVLFFIMRFAFLPALDIWIGIKHFRSYPALIAMAITGMAFTTLEFTFRTYEHYFIPMVPFVWILTAIGMNELWKQSQKGKNICYLALFATLEILIIHTSIVTTAVIARKPRRFYTHMEENLNKIDFNKVQKTFVWGTPAELYYIDERLVPSMVETYGYDISNPPDSIFMQRLQNADCFIGGTEECTPFLKKKPEIKKYLTDEFDEIETSGEVRIFVRKSE